MSTNESADTVPLTPPNGDTWIGLSRSPLPTELAMNWAVDPACGAVVSFSGTVRDHSDGRPGVSILEYEAYDSFVVPRFAQIVETVRKRWPQVHKVAVLHRVGEMRVTESSVFIALSAEHRESAFEAAKFCIDTLKTTVPIWKKEVWSTGSDWGADPHEIVAIEEF